MLTSPSRRFHISHNRYCGGHLVSSFSHSPVSPTLFSHRRHLYAAPSSFTAALAWPSTPFVGDSTTTDQAWRLVQYPGESSHSMTTTRLQYCNALSTATLQLRSESLALFWLDCLVILESQIGTSVNHQTPHPTTKSLAQENGQLY